MNDVTAEPSRPRGLFVLGAPRSGTTLVGNYLGSATGALNLGEYGGFHFAYNIMPSTIGKIPGPFRELYAEDLRLHAAWFAEELALRHGKSWYCDSTPWNLAAVDRMAADLPDAIFVLMLRHYSGCIQSLRRSFDAGYAWAGRTWDESAQVWASSYRSVAGLPPDRSLVLSYDALVAEPEATLELLRPALDQLGFATSGVDLMELTTSHAASNAGPRPTIGVVEDGAVRLQPIEGFAPERWSGDIHRIIWPIVRDVHQDLLDRFPGGYLGPPKPAQTWVHHDIEGLVPSEIDDNW